MYVLVNASYKYVKPSRNYAQITNITVRFEVCSKVFDSSWSMCSYENREDKNFKRFKVHEGSTLHAAYTLYIKQVQGEGEYTVRTFLT